ncbi:DgyrCDS9726 [Dimorphilus gyrociliatus]|uniref:DgyrCDS9726 n=1 Tax=Dimorphilus gyrociliatus TaxID=2664684 RepID=A0A7I8W006_9ANNE|nr:DgyrCDS9726 [Dimorphilus gyrociliatus]
MLKFIVCIIVIEVFSIGDCSFNSEIGFSRDVVSPSFVQEGDTIIEEFGVLKDWDMLYGSYLNCKVKSGSPDGRSLIFIPENFHLTPSNLKTTIQIDIPFDCKSGTTFAGMLIDCTPEMMPENKLMHSDIVSYVISDSLSPEMCGDPHLAQVVRGKDEEGNSVNQTICYDFYGKSGDSFELLSDKYLGVSIISSLRDDYYIGSIIIKTIYGSIEVTTKDVKGPNGYYKTWFDKKRTRLIDDSAYKIDIIVRNSITIIIRRDSRKLKLFLLKIKQFFGKSYLNINIQETSDRLGLMDKYHGGLLSLVFSNDYKFYEPVQDTNQATVLINDRIVKSFRKFKDNNSCYMLKIEDILFPRNIDVIKI